MTQASRKAVVWVWAIFFAGLVLGPVIWVSALIRSLNRSRAVELPHLGQVRAFEFRDQQGRPFTSQFLKGKIWVADFVFTRCAGPCPTMSSKMAELQKSLAHVSDVAMVSFSVDPEHDDPQVLAAYGKRYGAQIGRWFLLTGSQERLFKLMREDFKLGAEPAGADPVQNPILHDAHFVLVDEEGQIRGYYASDPKDPVPQIVEDIAKLQRR